MVFPNTQYLTLSNFRASNSKLIGDEWIGPGTNFVYNDFNCMMWGLNNVPLHHGIIQPLRHGHIFMSDVMEYMGLWLGLITHSNTMLYFKASDSKPIAIECRGQRAYQLCARPFLVQ